MYSNEISKRQLFAWSVGAIMVPLAQLAEGSCATIFLTGIIIGVFLLFIEKAGRKIETIPRWLGYIAVVWIAAKLIYLLRFVEDCWQADNSRFFVPIVLLTLAAWAASKGTRQVAKIAAIIFCLSIITYGVVGTASLGELKFEWILSGTKKFQIQSAIIFLLPLAVLFLRTKEKVITPVWVITVSGIGALFAVLINGILSSKIAEQYANKFYEMSRSIELFGIVQRFEVLVASIMAMGWFVLLSLYLSAVNETVDRPGKNSVIWGVTVAAGTAYILDAVIPENWILIADLLLCFLIVITAYTSSKKELKKREKRG